MRLGGICLLAAVLGSGGVASADEVALRLVGEAGPLGPPAYVVTVDGMLIGTGTLRAPDGATPRERTDLSVIASDRTFTIPDGLLQAGSVVKVYLINDSTDDTGADTTLYILGVSIDGVVADVAAAQPVAEPVTTEVAAVAEEPAAVKAPVAVTALKLPETGEGDKPVATASLAAADEPTANPACNRDELYNVVGFNESSNDLTPKLMERLDQIVADIGEQKCKVLVTGYSSRAGNHATNALFAIERAQNVLAYLKQAGLKFEKVSATGAGATEQFGDTFYANRRVVISVAP